MTHPRNSSAHAKPPTSQHLLVRAGWGQPIERPPVWAMRQAGRWDPEFNRLRQHGLTDVRWYPLTFGIATLYVGTKV